MSRKIVPIAGDATWFVVRDGVVIQNSGVQDAYREFQRVKRLVFAVGAALTGANLAALFRSAPWLESVSLRMECSSAYNDCGGFHRNVNITVDDITLVPGVEPPKELFDPELVSDWVNEHLEDDTESIYDSVTGGRNDDRDFEFEADRSTIEDLLAGDKIDGREVFVRLFPEHAKLVQVEVEE